METILILVFSREKPGGLTGALVHVHVQVHSVTSQTGVIMGLLVKINKQRQTNIYGDVHGPPALSSHWSGGQWVVDSLLSRDFSLRMTEPGLV